MKTCINCEVNYPLNNFRFNQGLLDDHCNDCFNGIAKIEKIKVKRSCLKCNRDFTADSKYLRLCIVCKNNYNWKEFDNETYVIT